MGQHPLGAGKVFDGQGAGDLRGDLGEALAKKPRWYTADVEADLVALRATPGLVYDILEDHFEMAMDFIAAVGGGYKYGMAQANFDWIGSMPAMVFAAFIPVRKPRPMAVDSGRLCRSGETLPHDRFRFRIGHRLSSQVVPRFRRSLAAALRPENPSLQLALGLPLLKRGRTPGDSPSRPPSGGRPLACRRFFRII